MMTSVTIISPIFTAWSGISISITISEQNLENTQITLVSPACPRSCEWGPKQSFFFLQASLSQKILWIVVNNMLFQQNPFLWTSVEQTACVCQTLLISKWSLLLDCRKLLKRISFLNLFVWFIENECDSDQRRALHDEWKMLTRPRYLKRSGAE